MSPLETIAVFLGVLALYAGLFLLDLRLDATARRRRARERLYGTDAEIEALARRRRR